MIPLVYIKCKIGKFFISSIFLFLLGINILVVHAHNPSDQNESFIQYEPAEQQIDSVVKEGKESCCNKCYCNKESWFDCCTFFVCMVCSPCCFPPCREGFSPLCNLCCEIYPCCPYWDKCANDWCPDGYIDNGS